MGLWAVSVEVDGFRRRDLVGRLRWIWRQRMAARRYKRTAMRKTDLPTQGWTIGDEGVQDWMGITRFDPDEALRKIREMAAKVRTAHCGECAEELHFWPEEFTDLIEELDSHIMFGGKAPKEWGDALLAGADRRIREQIRLAAEIRRIQDSRPQGELE